MRITTRVLVGIAGIGALATWAPDPCGACQCGSPPQEEYELALTGVKEIPATGGAVDVEDANGVIGEEWQTGCSLRIAAFHGNDVFFGCDDETTVAFQEVGDATE